MSDRRRIIDVIQHHLGDDEQRRRFYNASWAAFFLAALYVTNPAVAAAGILAKATGDAAMYYFLTPHRHRELLVNAVTLGAMALSWAYQPQLLLDPVLYTGIVAAALALQTGRILLSTARINGWVPH